MNRSGRIHEATETVYVESWGAVCDQIMVWADDPARANDSRDGVTIKASPSIVYSHLPYRVSFTQEDDA